MLIYENRQFWDSARAWSQDGEEWSAWWGTSDAQWFGCLLPRIFPFLNGRILEIGPGRGRWTRFLVPHCSSLIGVDVAQTSVKRCIERFSRYPNLQFEANDGFTLPMIESASIDFAFSFDSLVHAESDAMYSYAHELARVLKPGGVAFLHHSNLDAVRRRSVLDKVKRRLAGLPCDYHLRALSMSAEKMRTFVEGAGMSCAQQEIVPWGTGWPLMIDCMSTIVNAHGYQCKVIRNPRFMEEAVAIKHNFYLRGAKLGGLQIEDRLSLTDADWTAINKLKQACESGADKAISKALYELYKDPERAIRVVGAFYPDTVRKAIRDAMAETA